MSRLSSVEKSQDFITVKESRCLDARLADRLAKEGPVSSSNECLRCFKAREPDLRRERDASGSLGL